MVRSPTVMIPPLIPLSSWGAESGSDSGHKFCGAEGLGDVVVSTGTQSTNDVRGVGPRCEHDDRGAGFSSDVLADLDAVTARKHEVEEDECGFALPKDVHDVVAVPDPHG